MGSRIFLFGVEFGFVACAVIGFTLNQMKANRAKMGARNRPLDSFSDAGQPKQTATQIYRQSRRAFFSFIFWFTMLIIEIILAVYFFQQFWIYFSDFC